jgi:translation elongation factor EF-Tu-like GTPase
METKPTEAELLELVQEEVATLIEDYQYTHSDILVLFAQVEYKLTKQKKDKKQ